MSLSSSFKSLNPCILFPTPKFTRPKASPLAKAYPSLSIALSDNGFLPIYAKSISVINRLDMPLYNKPAPITAAD